MFTQSELNNLITKIQILRILYPNRLSESIISDIELFFNKIKYPSHLSLIPIVEEIEINKNEKTLSLEWYQTTEANTFEYLELIFSGNGSFSLKTDIALTNAEKEYNLNKNFELEIKKCLSKFMKMKKKKRYK